MEAYQTTAGSARARFETGFSSFVPAADDNPDCVPFYRAWNGLRAALNGFTEQYNSACHNACCMASWAGSEDRWSVVVASLKGQTDLPVPPCPTPYYGWESEPVEPGEADAVEEFRRQWRARYPGKRVNSKEAKAAWERVADHARKIVRDRYLGELERYQAKMAEREARYGKIRAEWEDRVHAMALYDNAVRDIIREEA